MVLCSFLCECQEGGHLNEISNVYDSLVQAVKICSLNLPQALVGMTVVKNSIPLPELSFLIGIQLVVSEAVHGIC